jgi:hypothetical protein
MSSIVDEPFILPTLLPAERLAWLQKHALFHHLMYKQNYNPRLGRHQFYNDKLSKLHRDLTEIAKDYFGSDTLRPTWCFGTIYETKAARINKGIEDRACDYNLDLAVFQKTAWPLLTEYQGKTEQHILAENDALFYYGSEQAPWRDEFPDPEHNLLINVTFCYAEPDHWSIQHGGDYIEVLRGKVTKEEYLARKDLVSKRQREAEISPKNVKTFRVASYPRSGNTLLRAILWHCFGLRSSSIYPNDLGGNAAVEAFAGHCEQEVGAVPPAGNGDIALIKTHELPSDDSPAIYVVRDGRAACVSLQQFYADTLSLESVIEGKHRFGTWSAHLESWHPWDRPNTLLLRYEDLTQNLPKVIQDISAFIKREAIRHTLPERDSIAEADGRWVKRKADWKNQYSADLLSRFYEFNGDTHAKMGYDKD